DRRGGRFVVTDDRDRDEAPVIKVTDKRRFAKLAEAEGPERPSASASDESARSEPAAAATDELTEARAKADEYLQPLQRLQAEGAPFDPNLHEALMQTGEGTGEPHVAEVFRPGYTLKGRVLRPAGVRVEKDVS